jgi:hypothetical protein
MSLESYKNVDSESLILSVQSIPNILAPYSWKAKIEKCSEYAIKAFDGAFTCNVKNCSVLPMPWELNTFMAIATIYKDGLIDEIPDPIFKLIINSIRTASPKRLYEENCDIKDYIACVIASIQMPYQQNQLILLLRYRFFYSYVNEKENINIARLFYSKFGVDGDDVFLFVLLLHMASNERKTWIRFLSDFCSSYRMQPNETFFQILNLFSIERLDFSSKQKGLFDFSTDGYVNANNLLEEHPFIRMKGCYYLPLPYLVGIAAARHLFDRLMPLKGVERSKMGGLLMEAYVYNLFCYSKCYDSIEREFKYRLNGRVMLSPDVIIRKSNVWLFVEVKLAEAPIDLRQMIPRKISILRKANAKRVFQLYSRIKEICKGSAKKKLHPKLDDVYGVVVVHEDAYILRDDIYEECFKAHPELGESEREFIKKRISITGVYTVEVFCYSHSDIFKGLRKRELDSPYQISLSLHMGDFCNGKIHIPLEEFKALTEKVPSRLFREA